MGCIEAPTKESQRLVGQNASCTVMNMNMKAYTTIYRQYHHKYKHSHTHKQYLLASFRVPLPPLPPKQTLNPKRRRQPPISHNRTTPLPQRKRRREPSGKNSRKPSKLGTTANSRNPLWTKVGDSLRRKYLRGSRFHPRPSLFRWRGQMALG